MPVAEPIIVVLGPWCGGTSAVAQVLHHLGVLMGTGFDLGVRELNDTWEDSSLSQLCRRAFSEPGGQLQMNVGTAKDRLRGWADEHRRAADIVGRRPGAKHPVLCVAVDLLREAWGPIVPVVVSRPEANVVASLNRLGWWKDEQERAESTAHLIASRDRALDGLATLQVDFEELRVNPAVVIRRLADELRLDVTETQLEAAVNSVVGQADVPHDIDPHQRLIDRFLPQAESNPGDSLPVYMLAQIYFLDNDFANARKYFAQLLEMGVQGEEEFFALFRIAQSMERLEMPWLEVQESYMRAWECRPTRAEPFYCIAGHYRIENRYRLGYLFAEHAAQIPLPSDDMIIPDATVYTWRATDELATCASGIGEDAESFELCRRLLSRPDIPDDDRIRISANRDLSVPAMLEAAVSGSKMFAHRAMTTSDKAEITVSLIAGPTLASTVATLNSFLHCCTDISQVERFLLFEDGRSAEDRASLHERYPFLEFVECAAGTELRAHIRGRYWLHVDPGWRFFATDNYIARLIAVLDAEPRVVQVGINIADAMTLNGFSAPEKTVQRAPNAGRYVVTDRAADGPAMLDLERLDRADSSAACATLDEVLCINFTD